MSEETSDEDVARTGGSKPAKILYKPVGIVSSIAGGVVAGQVFKQVYKRVAPSHPDEVPGPLHSQYRLREILLATFLQAAVFSVVKALIERGGARAFQKWTGEWPGD